MKKSILTLLILVITVSMSAQFQFGIKGGMNTSYSSGNPSMIPGAVAGGYVNYSFTRVIGLQAELLFSQQGTKLNRPLFGGDLFMDEEMEHLFVSNLYQTTARERLRLNYVNLPLLLEIKPFKKVHLGILIGPQVGYCVYRKHDSEAHLKEIGVTSSDYNNWDFSTVIGLQYLTPSHISVSLQYSLGWRTISTFTEMMDFNRVLQLSVGWTF